MKKNKKKKILAVDFAEWTSINSWIVVITEKGNDKCWWQWQTDRYLSPIDLYAEFKKAKATDG